MTRLVLALVLGLATSIGLASYAAYPAKPFWLYSFRP
jgi:hypothetical protein